MRIEKKCSGCKLSLPLAFYHKNSSKKDGRDHYCKSCKRKAFNPDTERVRRLRFPEKTRATRLVQQMLIRGVLEKEPCFICGQDKVEGHHLFYDHPKKVLWLCPDHHRKFHRVWKETS